MNYPFFVDLNNGLKGVIEAIILECRVRARVSALGDKGAARP